MQCYEDPNEETTLLAKHRRNMEAESTSPTAGSSLSAHQQWNWQRLRFYLIELMVLLLVFAYNLSATVLKHQIIFQTCAVIFEYNATDCRKLSTRNTTDYIRKIEEDIQPYVARFFMINSVIQSIVPALCGSFVGAWSDRFGRKPLLIASFTGYLLFYGVTSVISRLSDSFPLSPWYYLLGTLPLSLLGDGVTYSVATLCYISDVSTPKERPFRMAFYEACIYIGLMTGSFASGYIYENYNSATLVFVISTLCLIFATSFIICVIPESLNSRVVQTVDRGGLTDESPASEQPEKLNYLFDVERFRDMLRTCFKHREFEIRSVILLIVGCLITCAFVVDGSISIFYLFIREKFQWTVKEYTAYESISILVPIAGNILGIWLLRKVFHIKLLNVALLGLLSHISQSLMKGFAAVNWQLYLAIFLGVLKSVVNPMLHTVLSHLVPTNELGKIFSFTSALQAFVPFVASPLYTIVYSCTLETFPGFFNILSANLFLLATCLLAVVIRKKQKHPSFYDVILN